jgi:hypothetical protein
VTRRDLVTLFVSILVVWLCVVATVMGVVALLKELR